MNSTKITSPQRYKNILDEVLYFEHFLQYHKNNKTLNAIPRYLNPKNLTIPELIEKELKATERNHALTPYLAPHLSEDHCIALRVAPEIYKKRQEISSTEKTITQIISALKHHINHNNMSDILYPRYHIQNFIIGNKKIFALLCFMIVTVNEMIALTLSDPYHSNAVLSFTDKEISYSEYGLVASIIIAMLLYGAKFFAEESLNQILRKDLEKIRSYYPLYGFTQPPKTSQQDSLDHP